MDEGPPSRRYFSDGFNGYPGLVYKSSKDAGGKSVAGIHAVAPGKSQTCSVEGDNAELQHYPTKALPGAARPKEPLLLAVSLGIGTGGGVVCVCLEPAAEVQAGIPEGARARLWLRCRFNLDTPLFWVYRDFCGFMSSLPRKKGIAILNWAN